MYLGKADVNTYDKGVEREFLVSNDVGSYGFSTVVGANTRREHGLLVVRSKGSFHHTVLVSKLEETLYANGKKYQLSTNRYKELVYPDGYRYVQEHQSSPFPSFLFVVHSIFLKKSIFMAKGENCTVIKYELLASPNKVSMDIRPLFAHRSVLETYGPDGRPDFASTRDEAGVIEVLGNDVKSRVSFASSASEVLWSKKPLWFESLIYERNGSPTNPVYDSLWSPGYGSVEMSAGDTVYVVLSTSHKSFSISEIKAIEEEASKLTAALPDGVSAAGSSSIVNDLVHAASHLVAERDGEPVIFSGFPSVEMRARDTFIALPGLAISTGCTDEARGILQYWLKIAAEHGAVMPAALEAPASARPSDIDAGLWFMYAVDKYSTAVSMDFAKSNIDSIRAIMKKYIDGDEVLGAGMNASTKLMEYTNPDRAKNWMSGDVLGEALVSRRGYLVEVNALWYNALVFMSALERAAGGNAKEYDDIAAAVKSAFVDMFWNEGKQYLYDWVNPAADKKDESIRPNALLAVSLPHPVLDGEKAKRVFATCWDELYTTYGLRTLDPRDDKFKGRAEGRDDQKKKARLRGMAWPWLLGQFVTAYMRFNPDKKDMGWSLIRPFSSHLRRGCLSGVAEYFDGMMPYRPNGDVLSAISQGEIIRVIFEDLAK